MSCLLFHNWECFNDEEKVKSAMIQYLTSHGFYTTKRHKDNVITTFTDGKIFIKEWGFYNCDTMEGVMPFTCMTKVCVDCGKIKLTYNMEKCIKRLQEIIVDKTNEYNKRKKAEDILNEQRTS
jgi:hypothetical protein